MRERQSVKDSNVLIDFTIEVLTLQEKRGGHFLLEHPEDLGKRSSGQDPASVWQLETIQELGRRAGVVTGALRQSDWGEDYAKPTRFLGRWPGLETIVHVGEAQFDKDGGPLPAQATAASLIGKSGRDFRTAAAAGWPRKLCEALAEQLAKAKLKTSGDKVLKVGRDGRTSRASC